MSGRVTSGAAAEGPSAYPAQEESDVVLNSGSTLRLRPIRPQDASALLAFYKRLSPDSLYFRFFSVPRLDVKKAQSVCRVDYENTFAPRRRGRPAASSRPPTTSGRPTQPDRAEAAFAVEDALQGQGIGTRLLERLAEIARARGIRLFEADVLAAEPPDARRLPQLRLRGARSAVRGRRRARSSSRLTPTPRSRGQLRRGRSGARRLASMKRLFEPKVVAVIGASRERGKIGAEIFHNLARAASAGTVVPVNPKRDEILGVPVLPAAHRRPGPGGPRGHRDPGGATSKPAVDDCVAKGVDGHRRHHRRLLRDGRGGAPPGGGPAREDPGRRHPHGRAQLHGPPQHRSGRPPERDVRSRLSAGGPRRPLLAERRARARHPRLRVQAEPRHLDVRVRRQQGGRLGQRPDPVLGRGPAHRRDPALPGELRQPGPLLADRAPRRAQEADRRRQGRPLRARARARRLRTRARSPSRTRSSTRSSARRA